MKLKDYKNVADLKNLDVNGLKELAQDLRTAVTKECEEFEGHLGSNLAIVDLTLSLLRHFGYENARYLFDTSYQAYSFKRLTDRQDFYETVHTPDGYSIFQEIKEGDPFSGGHTSISAAWAAGYNALKDGKTVIEIIGDGSLAASVGLGGMLNFAHSKNKGLFILNDNKQGIGINQFNDLDWEKIATGMGYTYLKVNGHDYDAMEKTWETYDKADGPVFVHVETIKAYGYEGEFFKEQALHYITPHAKATPGLIASTAPAIEYIKNQIKNNKDAMVFLPGMVYVFGFNELKKSYPDQVIDTGIAEELAIIEAAAAANAGKEVYVMIFSSFFQRVYDQIVHDIIRNNSNITMIIPGNRVTDTGDSHHGIYDLNMYNAFENVQIYTPTTTGDFENAMKMVKNYQGPKVIRLENNLIEGPASSAEITKWSADIKAGQKIVISFGEAFEELKKYVVEQNLPLSLVKATSLNPIDHKLMDQIAKEGHTIYTYEHVFWKNNLASTIRAHYPDLKVKDFAFKNIFIGRWGMKEIMERNHMDLPYVTEKILSDK